MILIPNLFFVSDLYYHHILLLRANFKIKFRNWRIFFCPTDNLEIISRMKDYKIKQFINLFI